MSDIISELTQLRADHKAATDLLEASASEVETLRQQLTQAAEASQALASKDAEITRLVAELEQHKGNVATLEAAHKTAEEKAVAIVAAQGIAPMAVKAQATAELTKQEALAQYKALLGTDSFAAGTFYTKNKALFGK